MSSKRWITICFTFLAALMVGLTSTSAQGAPNAEHVLTVVRHIDVSVSAADVESILRDATNLLQLSGGANDVSCGVRLVSNGVVEIFSGIKDINTSSDLTTVFAEPGGYVKVVRAIDYCGGPIVGAIGCAPRPGATMVVRRYQNTAASPGPLEGALWAHEFGHNRTLSHRGGNQLLMNSYITAGGWINEAECLAFADVVPAVEPAVFAAGPAEPEVDIVEFVRRAYSYGLRGEIFVEATKYTEEDLGPLLLMLADDTQMDYWINIVGVIGIIGGVVAENVLIEFVEDSMDADAQVPLTDGGYRAARAAITSLGYAASGVDTEGRALGFLIRIAEDGLFQAAVAEPANDALVLDGNTAFELALGALAVSGLDAAGTALTNLWISNSAQAAAVDAGGNDVLDERSRGISELLSSNLATFQDVANLGLVDYYLNLGAD